MLTITLARSKKLRLNTKLLHAYDKANGSVVTVGVHKDAGSYPAKGKSGPTVAEVANWLEYGTERMPARSYMQSTIDENRALVVKTMDRALINIGHLGWTVQKALSRIGSQFLRAVQNKIKSNVGPELSDAYLKRKMAAGMPARTLIATTKLLSSMSYRVQLSSQAAASDEAQQASEPAHTSRHETGTAAKRERARQDAAARKAAAKEQRQRFKTDAAKQERFRAQQATKNNR